MKPLFKHLLLLLVTSVFLGKADLIARQAENFPVSGTVTASEDGSGLPGVTVVEQGTSNGTISDVSGNYTLAVRGPNAVLVFSYVGYVAEEIPVNGQIG